MSYYWGSRVVSIVLTCKIVPRCRRRSSTRTLEHVRKALNLIRSFYIYSKSINQSWYSFVSFFHGGLLSRSYGVVYSPC